MKNIRLKLMQVSYIKGSQWVGVVGGGGEVVSRREFLKIYIYNFYHFVCFDKCLTAKCIGYSM